MVTRLVTNARGMAIDSRLDKRTNTGTIIHSDQSVQFGSWAFTKRARDSGLLSSTVSIGDCYDNSMFESFSSLMQVELLDRKKWNTRLELANAIFEYLEIWHNRNRRHSQLGWLTPMSSNATESSPWHENPTNLNSAEPRGRPESPTNLVRFTASNCWSLGLDDPLQRTTKGVRTLNPRANGVFDRSQVALEDLRFFDSPSQMSSADRHGRHRRLVYRKVAAVRVGLVRLGLGRQRKQPHCSARPADRVGLRCPRGSGG